MFVGRATLAGDATEVALRLDQGCSSVAACEKLETLAKSALLKCQVACEPRRAELARARALLGHALESQIAAQRRNADDQKQELLRLREREAAARAEEALRQEQAALEREHQRNLELLAAQARVREAEVRARAEQQKHLLAALSVKSRRERLESCFTVSSNCEAVAAQLVEAAATPEERGSLAELYESWRLDPAAYVASVLARSKTRSEKKSQAPAPRPLAVSAAES